MNKFQNGTRVLIAKETYVQNNNERKEGIVTRLIFFVKFENSCVTMESELRKCWPPLKGQKSADLQIIETSTIKDDQTKIKRIRNLLIGLPQHHYRKGFFYKTEFAISRENSPKKVLQNI